MCEYTSIINVGYGDLVPSFYAQFWIYRIAQNFGGIKLWWSWNCKNIGGENFGGWQRQSPFNIGAHEFLVDKTLADWQ